MDPRAAAAAAKAYAKATRPWFKKKRFIIPIAIVVLLGIGGMGWRGGRRQLDDERNRGV